MFVTRNKTLKKFSIVNCIIVVLFGIYLFLNIYIDYPREIRISIYTAYLIFAIIRVIVFLRIRKK